MSRGFGFVTMSTVEEAEKAVEIFNRYVSIPLQFIILFFVAECGSHVCACGG